MKFVNVTKSVCLVLMIGLYGCVKETPSIKTNNMPKDPIFKEYWLGESKDYMYFKKGTWWVYKNMQNGKTDSVYVTLSKLDTSVVKGTESYSKHRTYTIEHANMVTKSTRFNKFYDWYSRQQNPDGTNIASNSTSWVRNKSAPGGHVQPCFHTPFTLNLRSDMPLLNNDTSLILFGKTYNNVKLFKLPQDRTYPDLLDEEPSNSNFYMYIYYAPGFGIIKYEEPPENKSIELVRSNIVQ
jgi:hypothetical protein